MDAFQLYKKVLKMKNVLITGVSGFVGRHFCRYFLENKFHVTGVDNLVKFTGAIDPTKVGLYLIHTILNTLNL